MIYFLLFLKFLKIGLFTFGGAYGAIPLIREAVLPNGWMNNEMFSNMLAISESTPGPIMVNAATYIGNTQGGIPGATVATLGVVLPSFVIIVLISVFLKKNLEKPLIKAALSGLKPCIAGIILATGSCMAFSTVFKMKEHFSADYSALFIFVILAIISITFEKIKRKPFSSILLICISAVCGIILY